MKAMVLAAGLGTRLRPLTDDRPKALVEINGRTLLEITLSRLRTFGVSEVIVNVHHFADRVADYLNANRNFGMYIEISREDELLDTGGGLKKAAWFLSDSHEAHHHEVQHQDAFIVHNVDVLSTIDLEAMKRFHVHNEALVTIAVQDRKTSRYLLFDEQGLLRGRKTGDHPPELAGQAQKTVLRAFSGIHVVSPRIFSLMKEDGAFSIIDVYLRLAAQGEKILAFSADEYYWRDLGTPANVERAAEDLRQKVIVQ
jgi:NDP-sugar pyrophosphorylase family protein